MNTYLVTGGGGFIGSNIVHELVARGEKVRVVDNFSTGHKNNISDVLDRIELMEADIRDLESMNRATEGIDFVLHRQRYLLWQDLWISPSISASKTSAANA